jgi:hypothetical protein
MEIEHYILTSIVIILTSLNYRTRNVLNMISQNITADKKERNNYEVVMQPKWFLNATWVLTILWLYLGFSLFQVKSWWAILYIVGFYFSVTIVSKLLPFPSLGTSVDLFYSTTTKRLANESKYTIIELGYLRIAKATLDKIRPPVNID